MPSAALLDQLELQEFGLSIAEDEDLRHCLGILDEASLDEFQKTGDQVEIFRWGAWLFLKNGSQKSRPNQV